MQRGVLWHHRRGCLQPSSFFYFFLLFLWYGFMKHCFWLANPKGNYSIVILKQKLKYFVYSNNNWIGFSRTALELLKTFRDAIYSYLFRRKLHNTNMVMVRVFFFRSSYSNNKRTNGINVKCKCIPWAHDTFLQCIC